MEIRTLRIFGDWEWEALIQNDSSVRRYIVHVVKFREKSVYVSLSVFEAIDFWEFNTGESRRSFQEDYQSMIDLQLKFSAEEDDS